MNKKKCQYQCLLLKIQKIMQFILHKTNIHFFDHLKYHYESSHFHQCFHYIHALIYQLTFFCTYNSYNVNIIQYHMIITFTFIINRIPNKSFITTAFINKLFTFTPAFIFMLTSFIITNTCI